ncbi:hypothetical protein RUM43_006750 [Polyplax serrata]|uniref:Uncharacterized protein n=1 Tax=Polyplax serrata TaxID=468196 RepID=A0AAN8PLE6_POLSC
MVTHSLTMLEKHLGFSGETPPRNFTTNRVKKRSIKSEDPMSHRIIEKRRRDRMNNCLADLSRLIPPEYLKKGRGRIEKTEIIEMAIKHIGHLQNIIASTRFNDNSNSSVPSPPAATAMSRDPVGVSVNQPLTVKHFRMGYLECMSEAMHFLVEVQGYFAGDSLCVQMVNHLRKHCDKMLIGDSLNCTKKQEATSSDSSNSPSNIHCNRSPPLGLTNSIGSPSDDNPVTQTFELRSVDEYCSPKRFSDLCCIPKKNEGGHPRHADLNAPDGEIRSNSDSHLISKSLSNEARKEESKIYFEEGGNCQRNYQTGESVGNENFSVKDEYGKEVERRKTWKNLQTRAKPAESLCIAGTSQLREMLTSPMTLSNSEHTNRCLADSKGNSSPLSNTSGCEGHVVGFRSCLSKDANSDSHDGDHSDGHQQTHHSIMYKFKNNIKQRFSKERQENGDCESSGDQLPPKKQKGDDYHRYEDSLMQERLLLLDRMDSSEEERIVKFNGESDAKKWCRSGSDSETPDGNDLSNRLNFGHRTGEKGKRWEDVHHRMWPLSPSASLPFYSFPMGCKPFGGRQATEFPTMNNSFNNLSLTSDAGPGIPIFALHAKGSFYIPLILNQATLAPHLAILGLSKTGEENRVEEKPVLHPVTISVNFQSQIAR